MTLDDYLAKLPPEQQAEIKRQTEELSREVRAMKVHEFTIILAGVDVITEEMAEAIFEAGCDDSSPMSRDGSVFVHFDREAKSLGDAVGSAISDEARPRGRASRNRTPAIGGSDRWMFKIAAARPMANSSTTPPTVGNAAGRGSDRPGRTWRATTSRMSDHTPGCSGGCCGGFNGGASTRR